MVGDLTYNSLQDLLGQVFLQLTVFVAYKMLKVPGAAAEGFASCHWCLPCALDTESSACTTLPFGVKIGKCCTPRCNGRDGDLDGLAWVAMVEPGFRFWEGRTSSRPNFRRWCMKIRFSGCRIWGFMMYSFYKLFAENAKSTRRSQKLTIFSVERIAILWFQMGVSEMGYGISW